MASELSKFIEDELLREGNTGERSRLINGGAFSVEKPKQRPTRFGLCTKRNIACFIILGIVVGAVGTAVYHKDKATEKIQGWARSKGGIPPSTTDQGPPPAVPEGNASPPANAVPDAAANPLPADAPPAEPAPPADGDAEAKPPPADPAPEGATPDADPLPEDPVSDAGAQPPPENAAGGRRMLRVKHI
mmetsp:Transcript_1750/g.5051  ORF Transcript_1750/g.5051 Transcript_1750/m.5051 type:complete len:189 (-) Transcript_1750:334-900(-)|eukprot:CAMPEP_0206139718 /NCGR_PEP_ID=MMETSP1473-20131121/7031_1 /ASSEMBLY_ACC=CAM_ASM_001109 /TAXON_ID=1461547 /ORGANISM="Stichococcus sp, Strain RCC1054" /LENGTH=188 /DNA_ID=CAMNT_0053533607 /DNA_START=257 /DNA_END=823 /DNA_ORIENTATION=+